MRAINRANFIGWGKSSKSVRRARLGKLQRGTSRAGCEWHIDAIITTHYNNQLNLNLAYSSFMISLAILRSLLSECKRDVGLFATSVVNILERALGLASKPVAGGGLDLDIAIRAVGVVSR